MGQLERPSWAGTSWTGTAGQGPAIRTRQALDRQGFLMCISICSSPSRIDSNKQCFHNQYMHTCLLRATIWRYTSVDVNLDVTSKVLADAITPRTPGTNMP